MFRLDKLTQKAQEALQQAQAVAEQNQGQDGGHKHGHEQLCKQPSPRQPNQHGA